MKHREGFFPGVQNLKLYWQAWLPECPKANVLIFHGFGEHSGRYRNVVDTLLPAGYALWSFDQHGHGQSQGKRGCIQSFGEYVENGRIFQETVVEGHLPLFVLGHSMGSIIAMNWLTQWADRTRGGVLSGTGMHMVNEDSSQYALLGGLNRICPNLTLKFPLPTEFISRDPQVVADYDADPLTHGRISVCLAVGMKEGLARARRDFFGLHIPILIQCGSEDQSFTGQQELFSALATEDKTLFIYQGLRHEVYNELESDRAKVLADLKNWLEARI